eukprot:10836008-Lingulodinium_polyedra.AAC.1
MRGPENRPAHGARSVRFVLRCNRETAIRPRRSGAFRKRCAADRRFAVATARKSHARALHARTEKP